MRTSRSVFAILAMAGLAFAQVPSTGTAPSRTPTAARPPVVPIVIGPPAPVPPEVAIPRPTPAELAQINQAVTRLIDSDKSADKALLKKYESLLMLQPPRLNVAATYTQTSQRMGMI